MPPAEYKQRICSWLGWAKYSDSKHLLKQSLNHSIMANYDAKPSKLEAVGNGSYLYRFNIEEIQSSISQREQTKRSRPARIGNARR